MEPSHTSNCEMDYCGTSKIGSLSRKGEWGMCSWRNVMMGHLQAMVVQNAPQHSLRNPTTSPTWKTMQRSMYTVTCDDYVWAFNESTLYQHYVRRGPFRKGLDKIELFFRKAHFSGDVSKLVATATNYTSKSLFTMQIHYNKRCPCTPCDFTRFWVNSLVLINVD